LKLRAKPLRYPFDISTYKLFSRGCSDMVARGLTVVPNYCDALQRTMAAGSGEWSMEALVDDQPQPVCDCIGNNKANRRYAQYRD